MYVPPYSVGIRPLSATPQSAPQLMPPTYTPKRLCMRRARPARVYFEVTQSHGFGVKCVRVTFAAPDKHGA